jgi:hypothetical protein
MNSLDFDRLTLKSASSPVAEIDMIIKNQLIRAKQQKVLRDLSDEQTLEFPSRLFMKSATCSGNATARVSTRATQQKRITGCKVQMNVAMTVSNANLRPGSSYNNSHNKKITLWRK